MALIMVTAAAAPALDLDAIAGVYKHRFKDGLVDGSTYTGENVLEVVKVSPTTAYVRTHLDFYNGHTCGLSGVAKMEGLGWSIAPGRTPPRRLACSAWK